MAIPVARVSSSTWTPRASCLGKVDTPLANGESRGTPVELVEGRVNGVHFRDFATARRAGADADSRGDALLLDWWLDANAYRGRRAMLDTLSQPPGGESGAIAAFEKMRPAGGICVWERRAASGE